MTADLSISIPYCESSMESLSCYTNDTRHYDSYNSNIQDNVNDTAKFPWWGIEGSSSRELPIKGARGRVPKLNPAFQLRHRAESSFCAYHIAVYK